MPKPGAGSMGRVRDEAWRNDDSGCSSAHRKGGIASSQDLPMTLEYSIRYEQSYVEVHASGQPDYLSADKLWQDIAAACRKHNCYKILGVADVQGWSKEFAYDQAAIFEAHGFGSEFRIAWVELNKDGMEMVKLAEAVIRNRDLASGELFDDITQAKEWLMDGPGNE